MVYSQWFCKKGKDNFGEQEYKIGEEKICPNYANSRKDREKNDNEKINQ